MKFKKYIIAGFGALFLSGTAIGDCRAPSLKNVCDAKIERLRVQGDGEVLIHTSGNESILACQLFDSYIVLRKSHPGFEEVYSLLLAAQLADRQVRVRMYSGTSICRVNYVWIK